MVVLPVARTGSFWGESDSSLLVNRNQWREREREREGNSSYQIIQTGQALLSSQIGHGSQIQAVPIWPPSTKEPLTGNSGERNHQKETRTNFVSLFLASVHTAAPSPPPSPPPLPHRFVASFGLYLFFSWRRDIHGKKEKPGAPPPLLLLSHPCCCSFFVFLLFQLPLHSAEEVIWIPGVVLFCVPLSEPQSPFGCAERAGRCAAVQYMEVVGCKTEAGSCTLRPGPGAMLFHGISGDHIQGIMEEMERRSKTESRLAKGMQLNGRESVRARATCVWINAQPRLFYLRCRINDFQSTVFLCREMCSCLVSRRNSPASTKLYLFTNSEKKNLKQWIW